ncbi:UbiE family methyltransferase [Schizosaccharomyces pombe]|uniref:Uncharacterized methyltransferase C1B3.06c n=1 Tax=Schizosaccharomyces pombe (strain 972 / ATCC 24843) TaxID=284812 RepID=YE16_SCHPO|nr:putative UbiE family methyltransferase [Schizosaccharomyces pombe]O13871.1 RecName: Full=Uncharacterized methyltransferase C1B3.06c [Schizosaccharomyces pombe 972h-]CAB11235.1 UbiE family methyltransferase (predicted) [Schizosaccharomyces pombe]|eukprot:NP_594790.1 putative UbiE family methyltransferase [Schizosaccharomyces pombe]
MSKPTDQLYYANGVDSYIAETHAWRTPETCSTYMLKYVKKTDRILDVGCGPGTITVGFPKYVPEGEVIGVEPSQELLDKAEEALRKEETLKKEKINNCSFRLGSIYKLPFPDNTFDIVNTHQVLVHLQDPVAALVELKRVTKPGGYVCCKEADLLSACVYPKEYEHDLLLQSQARINLHGTNPTAGRSLRGWAIDAKYVAENIHSSASTWCFADEETRKWVSRLFIQRVLHSNERLDDDDAKDQSLRKRVAEAWQRWKEDSRGCFFMTDGQIVYKKEE